MNSLPPTYVEGFHDLEAVKSMRYNRLGKTGLLVSKLSLGGGPFGCHYGTYDEAEAIETIRQAIRQGVNYIDTAPWYGQGRSETLIGKALKGIPRQAYYIATKVGRYELDFENMFDFTVEKTRRSLKKSLELLQLDYVDVIQVHDIEFAPSLDIIITQTLPELSRQVRDGKARFIGVTGYPISILKECIERSNIVISCVLTYSRYTLIDETLMDYVEFFKKNDIGIINAAGPCMGLLTNNPPPDWHPASDDLKEQCTKAVQCCKDHDENLARLAVWHSMQCKDVSTNLVGMQNLKDLTTNMEVLIKGISDKEKSLLHDLQEHHTQTSHTLTVATTDTDARHVTFPLPKNLKMYLLTYLQLIDDILFRFHNTTDYPVEQRSHIRYFAKVKDSHWEGVELKAYWKAMK